MANSSNSETKCESTLDDRLSDYPELRARIEALIDIMDNVDGDVVKADDAEERVMQEIRQIGRRAVQGWAERKHRRLVAEFDNRDGVSHKEKKRLLANPIRTNRNN